MTTPTGTTILDVESPCSKAVPFGKEKLFKMVPIAHQRNRLILNDNF